MKKLLIILLLILCFTPVYSQRNIFGLTLGNEIKVSDAISILQSKGISAQLYSYEDIKRDQIVQWNIDSTLKSHDVVFGGYSWRTVLFEFEDGFFVQATFMSPGYEPQRYKTIQKVLKSKYPRAFVCDDIDYDSRLGYRKFSIYLDEPSYTAIELFANVLGKASRYLKKTGITLQYKFQGELQIDSSHYNDL